MPGVSAGSRNVGAIDASKAMVSRSSGWPCPAARLLKSPSCAPMGQLPTTLRNSRRLICLSGLKKHWGYRYHIKSSPDRTAFAHTGREGTTYGECDTVL